MNTVIDVYFENAKSYVNDRKAKPDTISRSAFECELVEALLKSECRLEFWHKVSLVYTITAGPQFNRWWRGTKTNLKLEQTQIERYMVDQTLCYDLLSHCIDGDGEDEEETADSSEDEEARDSHKVEETRDSDKDEETRDNDSTKGARDNNEEDETGDRDDNDDEGAGSSTSYQDKETNSVGQDADIDPPSPDAATKYVQTYEGMGRRKWRRPLKDYGPEIERIEAAQAKEDGAYNPNKGLK